MNEKINMSWAAPGVTIPAKKSAYCLIEEIKKSRKKVIELLCNENINLEEIEKDEKPME